MNYVQRLKPNSTIREILLAARQGSPFTIFYHNQQACMTTYVKKPEFLELYLPYPETPPPQPCARPPPQLQCSQSQTPETGYVDRGPLPEYILNELEQEGIYQAGAWVDLPQDSCSKMVEKDVYKVLTPILEKITFLTRKYYPDLKRLPGKWLCTSQQSVQSWSG
jgi:hypothetical protein